MLRFYCAAVDCSLMGMAINNAYSVNTAMISARAADKLFEESAAKLATGKRITSSSVDAAGAAIAARMRTEIAIAGQAARNINDAIALLQTYEAHAETVVNIMQRMKEIAVAAANQTLSTTDVNILVGEHAQLRNELISMSKNAAWNGMNLFDGSAGSNGTIAIADADSTINLDLGTTYKVLDNVLTKSVPGGSVNGGPQVITIGDSASLQVGDVLNFTLYTTGTGLVQLYSYKLSEADINTINSVATTAIDGDPVWLSNNGQVNGYTISVSGSANSGAINISLNHASDNAPFLALDSANGVSATTVYHPHISRGEIAPLMGIFPYQPYGVQDTIKAVDSTLTAYTSKLAKVGSYMNRLESSLNAVTTNQSNLKASKSRIEDTDYARTTLDLTKSQIMKTSSMSMLQTAQDYKNMVLSLIS